MLAIEYHVHVWQVSLQLSCGDTCQVWMWCKESSRYFGRIENFAYGEINKRSFSNPPSQICILHLPSSLYSSGLVQDGSNSIADALELLQCCAKPSI